MAMSARFGRRVLAAAPAGLRSRAVHLKVREARACMLSPLPRRSQPVDCAAGSALRYHC